MYRFIGLASILVVSALQMGCCSSPCGKGMGCGRTYRGAYYDDPPTCEPCDNCGNFTGGNRSACKSGGCNVNGNGGCENQCDFNWKRGSRVSLWGGLFDSDKFDCLKLSCSEPSCGAPTCSEPSCGEPGCGSGPDCGCNHGTSYESAPSAPSVPMTSSRSPMRVSNVSYQANNWSNAKPCNCGKQH